MQEQNDAVLGAMFLGRHRWHSSHRRIRSVAMHIDTSSKAMKIFRLFRLFYRNGVILTDNEMEPDPLI